MSVPYIYKTDDNIYLNIYIDKISGFPDIVFIVQLLQSYIALYGTIVNQSCHLFIIKGHFPESKKNTSYGDNQKTLEQEVHFYGFNSPMNMRQSKCEC